MTRTPATLDLLKNRPLVTLMLGHFTVDTYAGLLPVLYPVLVQQYSLDLKTVGLVSLAYGGASSIVQPLFGWIADKRGTRLIGVALIWTASAFALIGLAPTFTILVLLAALAGIGSGMYHPFGALNASIVIRDPRQRNTGMSVYVTGGTLGVALGPLLGIMLFGSFGSLGAALTFPFGVAIAIWLLSEMRSMSSFRSAERLVRTSTPSPVPILPRLAVIGVMMSRQWTMSSLQAYIPTWFHTLGYPSSFYGPLSTTVVLASAIGAIGAGSIADRFGRRVVIIASLLFTIPALLLFAEFQGPISFLSVALVGLSAASTGPLMIVLAQQLMVGRAGTAAGLILGLGFIGGAVGIPIMGALADSYGMVTAIRLQVIVVFLTIFLALLLPTEARMAQLRSRAALTG
jgi:FSR family fosmidomycin resistance protein-like MFS transporter